MGPGPLQRVTRADSRRATVSAEARSYTGDPVNLSLRGARLRDVLCAMGGAFDLSVEVPRGLRAEVDVFANELPWDLVLETIIASAGLAMVVEGDRLVISSAESSAANAGVDACDFFAADLRRTWWKSITSLDQIAIADVELVGLARVGETWQAYAYGPARKLWTLEAGQALLDGRVRAVSRTELTLETDGGITIALPFLPRR